MFVVPRRLLSRFMRKRPVSLAATHPLGEQSLYSIWESAADAMVLSNPDGIVLTANPAYYELYGYTPEQVLGQSFAIIFPAEHRASAVAQYKAIFHNRTVIPTYESSILRSDGSKRMVETRATFVSLGDAGSALLSVIRDVTARKQLEDERDHLLAREQSARREAEAALQARDQFLAVAAHELKTPLTALRGYTQAVLRHLEREQTLSNWDERAIHIIDTQAKRLQGLINSLLDIGHIQAGRFQLEPNPLDLCDLVQAIVEELQPALERHTINIHCHARSLMVSGDAQRLEQVVQNLLQNALKYSPGGGAITVTLQAQDGQAQLTVSDNGIGIPEAALASLFQQFYRANNVDEQQIQGMGIGLFVVKEIVSLHGGKVQVDSRQGEGSTFTILLPLIGR